MLFFNIIMSFFIKRRYVSDSNISFKISISRQTQLGAFRFKCGRFARRKIIARCSKEDDVDNKEKFANILQTLLQNTHLK